MHLLNIARPDLPTNFFSHWENKINYLVLVVASTTQMGAFPWVCVGKLVLAAWWPGFGCEQKCHHGALPPVLCREVGPDEPL